MNDRFAAQLRQHLLDTADERPARDQLATVVDRVAVTRQRRRFAAGLAWSPGPAVRYGLIAIALVGALAAALLFGAGTGPTPVPSSTPAPTLTPVPEPTASTAPPEQTLSPSLDTSSCTQFDSAATYTANAGTLPVVVAVPATASSPWSGSTDEFELRTAACGATGPAWINASLVAHVYADSCHWKGSSVEAPTVRDVMGKLLTQAGHETDTAPETHLGAFQAQRLDLKVPAEFDASTCDDGVLALWETPTGMRTIDPGATVRVYVAEVDGVTLVVSVAYVPKGTTPDLLSEIDALLANLRIDI